MSTNVIELYPRSPIGQFFRLSGSPRLLLEEALASGRLMRDGKCILDRVVVDGALVEKQSSLLTALVASGAELTLETNVAELSSIGRYAGAVRQAPWAVADRALEPADWDGARGYERISNIARFAVEKGFSRVLSPSHLVSGAHDPLFELDIAIATRLRHALDENGGEAVTVDYGLLLPYHGLRSAETRAGIIQTLHSVPFENLWLRISQFGRDASPLGIRRYIDALRDFIDVGRPVIADGVAGFAGLATVAFGAAGGLSHGIGVHERFDASSWNKPAKKKQAGGLAPRALIASLDRQLTYDQIRMIAAAGGQSLVSCNEPCCRKGLPDMLDDPRTHYIQQRRGRVHELSGEPPTRRADYFVHHMLVPADRRARRMSRLSLPDPKLSELLMRESQHLERVLAVLDNLREHDEYSRRSLTPRAVVRPKRANQGRR